MIDPAITSTRRRLRGMATASSLAIAVALVFYAYAFFGSAGFSPKSPPSQRYFNMLANAFLAGQLHLLEAPTPALLAQADPYDYATSHRLWKYWDASLFEGKYYFYWGPVPALIAAAAKIVLGHATVVSDRALVLTFLVGRLITGAAILLLVQRWLFPRLSAWTPAAAVLVFGLANPYPYELGRPGVYEAAIDGGQFFLLLGMLAALASMHGCRTRSRDLLLLAVAGCSWAAAVGSRISLLIAIGATITVTALVGTLMSKRAIRELVVRALLLGTPVAVAVLALGYYNYARFGSFTDFGTGYMLTRQRYNPDWSFLLPNLQAYIFRPFTVSCEFPYLGAPFFAYALTPAWVAADSGYVPKEPLVGLVAGTPGVLFGLAAIAFAGARLVDWSRSPSQARVIERRDAILVWLAGTCTVIVLLAGLPTLGVWFSTMRYLSDIASAALILAIVGFWALWHRAPRRSPDRDSRGVAALGATLALYTIAVGVLLGFQGGYFGSLRKHNPELHQRLSNRFSLCEPKSDAAPKKSPRSTPPANP